VLSLQKQINMPDPKPLRFDSSGVARIGTDWATQTDTGVALVDRVAESKKVLTLHIRVTEPGRCIASWRTRVWLGEGQYRFECEARSAGVIPFKDMKGEGGGIGFQVRFSHVLTR
jgi:hypothetical protein